MLSSYHGRHPLTTLLLRHGADPNSLNQRSQSPLSGAIFKGEDAIVEALLDGGADPRLGTPSAIEAVRIFGQEEKWGERLRETVERLESVGNGGGQENGEAKVQGE